MDSPADALRFIEITLATRWWMMHPTVERRGLVDRTTWVRFVQAIKGIATSEVGGRVMLAEDTRTFVTMTLSFVLLLLNGLLTILAFSSVLFLISPTLWIVAVSNNEHFTIVGDARISLRGRGFR